jgi:Aerotolerance regulator N-terminal
MWLAPWFLLGLVGIGLPLWLHRFARKTDLKRPFASLMFLEASIIRRSRRHELRYWLLLALRLLLLALLALAFAGPLWRSVIKPGATVATLHVIAMDTSLSMQQSGVWDRAREQAGTVITSLKGADRAMLVAADHRLRVLHEPVFAAGVGELRAALATLTPGSSRLDYGALMAGASTWGAGPGERVLVHLVTDMQQSASPLRFADLRPPPGVGLELVDVGASESTNLRVSQVREAEREPGIVLVQIEGNDAALAGRELVLEVNGVERARRALRPKTALPAIERFEVGVLGVGEHRLAARLEPADALPQDDAHFNLVRRVEPKVLVIAATPEGDDSRYLLAALQSLVAPRFAAQAAPPSALVTRQLGDFAAIVVSDAGLLSDAATDALQRYVEAGGAALLTLGARAGQRSSVPVSGATLARGRARAAGNEPARVAELEQSHAVLREPGAWRRIRFFRHVAVQAPDDAQVLMRFENGTPLMLEQTVGKGKLLVFASPLDRQWNDLAIHPLFVRFVAEATAYLSDTRLDAVAAIVGTSLDASRLGRGGGQVFDPQGKRASLLGGIAGGTQWLPDLPGFYELRASGRSDYIAVNVDPRESRLARWDADSRMRWLALQNLQPAVPQTTAAAATPGERLRPIWFWLLLAAAVLAFLEPLVANYHLNVQRERSA